MYSKACLRGPGGHHVGLTLPRTASNELQNTQKRALRHPIYICAKRFRSPPKLTD